MSYDKWAKSHFVFALTLCVSVDAFAQSSWKNITRPKTFPGSSDSAACPDGAGGWWEKRVLSLFQPPSTCPQSYNDTVETHSHGVMHGTAFVADNILFGVYDNTGDVFGSADLYVRMDPTRPTGSGAGQSNPNAPYAEHVISNNYRGSISTPIKNVNDLDNFNAGCSSTPMYMNYYNTGNSAPLEASTTGCAIDKMRQLRQPDVYSQPDEPYVYMTWVQRYEDRYSDTRDNEAWRVYVGKIDRNYMHSEHTNVLAMDYPLLNSRDTQKGGSLNFYNNKNAFSPKITVINGEPWVIYHEDYGSYNEYDPKVVHFKSSTNQWESVGGGSYGIEENATPTGNEWWTAMNCTSPSTSTAGVQSNCGYSADIDKVYVSQSNIYVGYGYQPIIITSSAPCDGCEAYPKVSMWTGTTWERAGLDHPGDSIGLRGDLRHAMNPSLSVRDGYAYATWSETDPLNPNASQIYMAALYLGAGPNKYYWQNIIGGTASTSGTSTGKDWGTGSFPNLLAFSYDGTVNGTQDGITLAFNNNAGKLKRHSVIVNRQLSGMVKGSAWSVAPRSNPLALVNSGTSATQGQSTSAAFYAAQTAFGPGANGALAYQQHANCTVLCHNATGPAGAGKNWTLAADLDSACLRGVFATRMGFGQMRGTVGSSEPFLMPSLLNDLQSLSDYRAINNYCKQVTDGQTATTSSTGTVKKAPISIARAATPGSVWEVYIGYIQLGKTHRDQDDSFYINQAY